MSRRRGWLLTSQSRVRSGLPVRCRPPEVLFDADHEWWRAVAGLPWRAVYARHAAHLDVGVPAILEYPLQGLNAELARRLRPEAVVAGPEAALGEVAELAAALAGARPAIAVEVLAFGRQQVLVTRDRLGLAEGLLREEDDSGARLALVDGKGYMFPVDAEAAGTRIFNARVTNTAPHLAELADSRRGCGDRRASRHAARRAARFPSRRHRRSRRLRGA